MLKQLRIRFICITMSFVTIMLCTILGMVVRLTAQSMEFGSLEMMRSLVPVPGPPGPPQKEVHLPYFTVTIDHNDNATIHSGFDSLTSRLPVEEVIRVARDSQERSGVLKAYGLRFLKASFPGGERIIFADISSEQATLRNLVKNCILIGILSFILFLGLSVLLARWAIHPVEQAWKEQKQFVADASHELKTPLTVIMTNAEMLQHSSYSEQARQQFSESILIMSRQMRGLVEALLELARVDNGAVSTGIARLNISELVSDGVLPFEPLFYEKQLTLISQVEPGILLYGSAPHLKQVLDILLDNAMKYTAPEGSVNVRLVRQGSHCLLSVSSPGAALNRDELKDIFKRFYRGDKARSRDGSYGLGLSIAARIVEEHRGKIWAESNGGINTFLVQLPLVIPSNH